MTRTVLIEGLIDVIKGIANKITDNPTGSHLTANVTSDSTSVLLTGAAKNTALKQLLIDFEPYQRDTPSTEEPATIFAPEFYSVFTSENEIVEGEEPEGELHSYAINLGRVVYGGKIDIKNKKVLVTWEYIEEYNGEELPNEWLSTMDVYEEGATPTTGAGVAYKIAEPYYIDIVNIVGEPIKTIKASNDCYVTCDTVYTKSLNIDYVRDEALAIENLEQSGGGGATTEVIMGDLDRVYGTTPANYIGTFNQWTDIDSGKSFSDYDAILLICKRQADAIYGTVIYIDRTDVALLQHYDKTSKVLYPEGNTYYVKYGLDYTNNKFYLDNWNYCCPIALVGVKY